MTAPRLDTTIRLPDGRRLAFAEYGSSEGAAVILFHGLPGSRLSWGLLPGEPFPPGLRIIAPDRPGYGRSDPKPGRTLIDWADDVAVLADELELARFSLVGVSGGGPGALACAWKLPKRVLRVGVVAGGAPTDAPGVFSGMSAVNRFFMRLAWRSPRLSALNTRLVASVIRRNPGRYIDIMQRKLHDVDRSALARPGIRDMLVRDFTEALHRGGQGMVDDMAANHGRPWGFALDRIEARVLFWYGSHDRSVSPAMGRYLAGAVPEAEFHLVDNAGHLWSLLHLREVLDAVAGSGGTEPAEQSARVARGGTVPASEATGEEETRG